MQVAKLKIIITFILLMMMMVFHPSRAWILSSRRFSLTRLSTTITATTTTPTTTTTTTTAIQHRGDWESSEFATHVVAGTDAPTVEQAMTSVLNNLPTHNNSLEFPRDPTVQLSVHELLHIGAVWFAPAGTPRSPAPGSKPTRLTRMNATRILLKGDYLRIHPKPRRFPQVYDYHWNGLHPILQSAKNESSSSSSSSSSLDIPGVIIEQHPHFLVIDKPANIPVHPTVDNCIENVAHMIQSSRNGGYVGIPQRLDQNTSGLFVVATTKVFATYFASLLSQKTLNTMSESVGTKQTIHKQYKCLLCILEDPSNPSCTISSAMTQLHSYDLVRHYLEPSIRSPKNYAKEPQNDTWSESWMRVIQVGEPLQVIGTELEHALWKYDQRPKSVVGVVEVEVELLTGRTHQIRGQWCTEGFPLVGDAQYGGAIPMTPGFTSTSTFQPSEQLALQCCALEFLDPDVKVVKYDGTLTAVPSSRWNRYQLNESWWSKWIPKCSPAA